VKTLLFQHRFADAVQSGVKRQTIRPARQRPVNAGDSLSLRKWKGKAYRSQQIEIATAKCIETARIEITQHGVIVENETGSEVRGGAESLHDFAKADGFESWGHMRDWFKETHGLPFHGVLIRWELLA
jgi:hypothetical protein